MNDQSVYLDLIRLMARGDTETYRQRCRQLDAAGWDGFALVVGAAFFQAVDRRFDASMPTAQVIRFVAETRADISETGFDLDPKAAETVIQAALTGETDALDALDANLVVESEMLLLWNLLRDLPEDQLEGFLGDAGSLARDWATPEG